MIFSINNYKWFVPKLDWNKGKDEELVKVKIKKPTALEKEQLFSVETKGKAGQEDFTVKTETDTKRIMKEFTLEIKNLKVQDEDGKLTEVKTGDELLKTPGLYSLVDAICNEVVKEEVDQITEKN